MPSLCSRKQMLIGLVILLVGMCLGRSGSFLPRTTKDDATGGLAGWGDSC